MGAHVSQQNLIDEHSHQARSAAPALEEYGTRHGPLLGISHTRGKQLGQFPRSSHSSQFEQVPVAPGERRRCLQSEATRMVCTAMVSTGGMGRVPSYTEHPPGQIRPERKGREWSRQGGEEQTQSPVMRSVICQCHLLSFNAPPTPTFKELS